MSNNVLVQRTIIMFGMLAAVAFLLSYLVNKAVRGVDPQQPVVGRFTKRFIAYSICALVTLAASLMQLFGPNGAQEFVLGIVSLIFVLRFAYLAMREYQRTSSAQ
jgi:hypothetical protein